MILATARHLSKGLAQRMARLHVQVAAGMSSASPSFSGTADSTAQKAMSPPTQTDQPVWSESYSFASPESDFCAQSFPVSAFTSSQPKWSEQLSFASPESDFCSQSLSMESNTTSHLEEWSHTLSFESPESDFCSPMIPPQQQEDIQLPRTLSEALRVKDEALVVTTAFAPHKIVHVNAAWESLCGYTKYEALDQSLHLIQGPESDTDVAEEMVQRLTKTHEPQEAYLTNYTKDGREFVNHVHVGELTLNNEEQVEFFVGILREVSKDEMQRSMNMA